MKSHNLTSSIITGLILWNIGFTFPETFLQVAVKINYKKKYMCTLHEHLYFLRLDILTTGYLFGGPILSVYIRYETISFVLLWRKPAWFAFDIFAHRNTFLPPANEVCEGYVFAGVCLSTGGCLPLVPEGGVCHTPHPGQMPPLADTPPWVDNPSGQTPPLAVHAGIHTPWAMHAGIHPRPVHAGIRSTSRRYTSHWNAFLLSAAFFGKH